jgi:two-component system KDP operon response regulator KdpE
MTRKSRVLLVDDEPQITRVLRHAFESEGFDVRVASDGLSGFEMFQAAQPDLVITDLAMPNVDGAALCKRIRSAASTPIIVLSVKGEEKTKVEALDSGADDYITKPFGIEELLARVRAQLRRVQMASRTSEPTIVDGDFRVDTLTREVRVRGEPVHLTPKEYDLLLYMLSHSDRPRTYASRAAHGRVGCEQRKPDRVSPRLRGTVAKEA